MRRVSLARLEAMKSFRPISRPVVACYLTLLFAVGVVAAADEAKPKSWIRVNLVGYLPDDPKLAVLSSDVPLQGDFTVGDFSADIGPDLGDWGPFAHNYRLDFSSVRGPGRFRG